MKKKFLTILMVICMTIVYMPSTAFAEGLNMTSSVTNSNNSNINDSEDLENVESEDLEDVEDVEDVNEEAIEDFEEESEEDEDMDIEDLEYSEEIQSQIQQINDLTETKVDFSSKRLIVKESKKDLTEELKNEPIIAQADGVYLLQYDDYMDAINTYSRLSDMNIHVEFDSTMTIASQELDIMEFDSEGNDYEAPMMTEEENPFVEADEVKVNPEKYDVAVIDTGANDADKVVSVLGDNGKDNNGHGQKMINTIKQYAPKAKILSIKAISDDGVGDVSAVYAAIRLAMDEKVDVINLSISALATDDSFIIEEIIKEAESQGITVVGAAGNNSMNVSLTIPGKVKEATIVGIVDEEGNTGDTVDYYVTATSTSVATAAVTGLIVSDTLKDYSIKDKVIDILVDEGDVTGQDATTDFSVQGEGSHGDSGTIHGGSGPAKYFEGTMCVWYDHGKNSDGKYYQGSLYKNSEGEYHWTRPTADAYQNEDKYSTAKKACVYFWLNKLSNKIQEVGKDQPWGNYSDSHYKGYVKGWSAGQAGYDAFADSCEKSCKSAIKRSKSKNENNIKRARVVGAAVTYYSTDTGHKSGWGIGNVGSGKRDYYDLFKRHGYVSDDDNELDWKMKFDHWDEKQHLYGGSIQGNYIGSDDETYGNEDKKVKNMSKMYDGYLEEFGWIPSSIPNSWEYEEYRDYIWKKIGKDANPDDSSHIANINGRGWRVIIIALNDDEPGETPIYLQFKKQYDASDKMKAEALNNPLYSLEGIKFKVYTSATDAKNDTNVKYTFTTDENGETPSKKVKKNTTYYITETVPRSSGLTVPDVLKPENGGKKITVGSTSKTITIKEGNVPTYGVNYTYRGNLPAEVMATLPQDYLQYEDGDTIMALDPTSETVMVGDVVYEFDGWIDDDLTINGGPVTFVGTWSIAETIPYSDVGEYSITTSVTNGTITDSTVIPASGGDDPDDLIDKTIEYSPNPGYVLGSIVVDGIEIDITEYPTSYTFTNINTNHTIHVTFVASN